ncbi:hypothetical protein ABI59_22445 [Acidobacteria bacterium Mor1]|nr:hypothetical protein ABI59_22445 [Acidobacteria bacterium Mor1]
MKRRIFLKSGSIALVGMGLMPRFLARASDTLNPAAGITSHKTPDGKTKTVVVLFLRGAADGLNMVVPYRDPDYYKLRPSIAIPRPGKEGGALELDGRFGLHPALAPLRDLWREERLAIVHAAGSPDSTRSHFDAQDFMESGTPGVKSTRDGWMNRYLRAVYRHDPSHFRAVALSGQLPRSLSGPAPALAIPELTKFGFPGGRRSRQVQSVLESLYAGSDDALLEPTAEDTFEAVEALKRLSLERLQPEHGADYPRGEFGGSLRQIAQLIKAGVGLELAFTELGGWDTHVNQGQSRGPLANLLRRFSAAVGAFCRDLGPRMDDVVLVTLSEFGRTAFENGNRGTDHGHANAMFLIGGGIRGGFHGEWPGLDKQQLNEGRELALTTDFRTVLGEVLHRHLGASDLASVFPGFDLSPDGHRGLFATKGA